MLKFNVLLEMLTSESWVQWTNEQLKYTLKYSEILISHCV